MKDIITSGLASGVNAIAAAKRSSFRCAGMALFSLGSGVSGLRNISGSDAPSDFSTGIPYLVCAVSAGVVAYNYGKDIVRIARKTPEERTREAIALKEITENLSASQWNVGYSSLSVGLDIALIGVAAVATYLQAKNGQAFGALTCATGGVVLAEMTLESGRNAISTFRNRMADRPSL